MFNLWYTTHILLGIVMFVMLFLHSVSFAIFVTVWWTLDIIIRYGIIVTQNKSEARIRVIGDKKRPDIQSHEPAVEVLINKPPGFRYQSGQFVRVAIPAISAVEFHPFSISSAPNEECITLHVRRLGDWTDKLVQLAEKCQSTTMMLEGPYGASSVGLYDDDKHKLVLFVCGGIGVTPCQSIGKELLHSHRAQKRELKQLRFVWVVRDLGIVHDIPPLLLQQEPDEDYSTSSPEYRGMIRRSDAVPESCRVADAPSQTNAVCSSGTQSGHEMELSVASHRSATGRRPAIVQVDIYCTRNRDDVRDTIDEEGERVRYNIYKGRPDLDKIFEAFKEDAIAFGERNVVVIGCGPPSLMSALHVACRKHSATTTNGEQKNVFFNLQKQNFSL